MLRCKQCSRAFRPTEAIRRTECFRLDGRAAREDYLACPECGGTDLEEGSPCPLCGGFSQTGLCESCGAHVRKALKMLVGLGKTERAQEAILDEINDYLEES